MTHILIPPPIHTPLVPPNRYSVGRITPDAQRDVGPGEFSHWPAVRFPPAGSPTMPPHSMHAFKWRDYCPAAFRALRAMFGIDPGDYMVSLCGDDALRELSSPGKSGSVFFLSHDDRFLIKTMRSAELQVLLRMLPAYYRHVKHNTHTLLTKFFGLHAIKIYHTADSANYVRQSEGVGANPIFSMCDSFATKMFDDCKGLPVPGTAATFGQFLNSKERMLNKSFGAIFSALGYRSTSLEIVPGTTGCYNGPSKIPPRVICCDPLIPPANCPAGTVDNPQFAKLFNRTLDKKDCAAYASVPDVPVVRI
ncbi:unnamed protein product [Closterium sp. NIES-54]